MQAGMQFPNDHVRLHVVNELQKVDRERIVNDRATRACSAERQLGHDARQKQREIDCEVSEFRTPDEKSCEKRCSDLRRTEDARAQHQQLPRRIESNSYSQLLYQQTALNERF